MLLRDPWRKLIERLFIVNLTWFETHKHKLKLNLLNQSFLFRWSLLLVRVLMPELMPSFLISSCSSCDLHEDITLLGARFVENTATTLQRFKVTPKLWANSSCRHGYDWFI